MDQDLIDRIYNTAVAPETWRDVVRDIAYGLGAHSGSLIFSGDSIAIDSISVAHGVFEHASVVDTYFSEFRLIDPAVALFAGLPTGSVASATQSFDTARLAKDVFYQEFFRKLDLVDSIGCQLIRDDRGAALLTFQRDAAGGLFDAADFARFSEIAPHVRRALALYRAFAPSRRAAAAFADVLDHVSAGMVAIDADGRVWHVNRAAGTILAEADGLAVRAGRLVATARAADARLAALVGGLLARVGAGGTVDVPRPSGRAAYRLTLSPVAADGPATFALPPARGALVVIADGEAARRQNLAAVAARYRLTRAEATLLAALVAGASLKSYCESARISVNTGRFHLRSLFAKTEARSQADLIRIALLALAGD